MKIEFTNRFKIQQLNVQCNIDIPEGDFSYLAGENGVGKSSLIQFFKLHQAEFFSGKRLIFVDQLSLKPLNEISFAQLEQDLSYLRNEELDCYQSLEDAISDFKSIPINDLSGGQNQLVKLALALFLSGDIFIFDEPLQYLDSHNVELILKLLKSLKDSQKTILLVEHRMDAVKHLVDNYIIMDKQAGQIEVRPHGN